MKSVTNAFFTKLTFGATSGSAAERLMKCLMKEAKIPKKAPSSVARTTIFLLCGESRSSGVVAGLINCITTGS